MAGKRKETMDIREMLRHLRLGQSNRAVAEAVGVEPALGEPALEFVEQRRFSVAVGTDDGGAILECGEAFEERGPVETRCPVCEGVHPLHAERVVGGANHYAPAQPDCLSSIWSSLGSSTHGDTTRSTRTTSLPRFRTSSTAQRNEMSLPEKL